MKIVIGIGASILSLTNCSPAKYAVTDEFSNNALRLPVKGVNGWMVNQQLSFGQYITSSVKRGWDFSSTVQYNNFVMSPQEQVLKIFNIDQFNGANKQNGNFQYTLEDGKQVMAVYATEKFSENELVYKSNNPYIGQASQTLRYEYAFSAALVPVSEKENPWQLVLINRYDAAKDRNRNILKRPYVEEEGYATNGRESIAIRPKRMEELAEEAHKKKTVGNLLAGYEIRRDNTVIAIIDILDNAVWIANSEDAFSRIVIASVASAILLKRIKDVEEQD